MSKATPEQEVKGPIYEWLAYHPKQCIFWPHYNGAVYDPKAGKFRKPNSRYYRPGVSDIIGVWMGAPLAIETKGPNATVTDEQIKFLTDIAAAGGIGILAYRLDDVIQVLGDLQPKRSVCFIGTRPPRRSRQSSLPPGFLGG